MNLSSSEMIQIFMSIYEDTEKEPWEWVRDFLSDYIVDEVLEYIQMFHLSRRLEGTDLKANNNLEQLLLEESPLSNFFKKYNIIETTKTDAGTRVLPITEDVAEMFQAIIEDRNATKVEKSIDGYSGFLFYDDNGMPLVAMHCKW